MYAVATLDQRAIRLPYLAPQVDLRRRELGEEPAVPVFAILGFVAFAVVMAWGAWCSFVTHGNFYFGYDPARGFVVACTYNN
jgi:hypothetical protein